MVRNACRFARLAAFVVAVAVVGAVPQFALAEEGGGSDGGQTWTMRAGGIKPGSIFEGELGFSALPRIAYHYTIADGFSIGGMFTFDFQYYYLGPGATFTPGIGLQMPLRINLYNQNRISVGLRTDPGIGFSFPAGTTVINILLDTSVNVGYWAVPGKFLVGGGLQMPVAIAFATAGGNALLIWPLLFGPIIEFHPIPEVAITADLKFGPHINSNPANNVHFGARMLVGAAYHF